MVFHQGHLALSEKSGPVTAHSPLNPGQQQVNFSGLGTQGAGDGKVLPPVMAGVRLSKIPTGQAHPGPVQVGVALEPAKLRHLPMEPGPAVQLQLRKVHPVIGNPFQGKIVQVSGQVPLGKAACSAQEDHPHLLDPTGLAPGKSRVSRCQAPSASTGSPRRISPVAPFLA